MSFQRLLPGLAAILIGITPLTAQEGTGWELWSDKTQLPPDEMTFGLPIVDSGENVVEIEVETTDGPFDIDVEETMERDGLTYKSLQWTRDAHFEVTVPVNKYLFGLLGQAVPEDSGDDPVEIMKNFNLVSVEIDGTVIPIDESFLHLEEGWPEDGFNLGSYNVYPIFTVPGQHTYVQTFQQIDPYFTVLPYEEWGVEDPTPELEGRRVYVPEEKVGDPVDGKIVFSYTLTVEEAPTAVESESWGGVKKKVVASE